VVAAFLISDLRNENKKEKEKEKKRKLIIMSMPRATRSLRIIDNSFDNFYKESLAN